MVIEVVHGVEGDSLYINDTRVAGPKPWGGGRVIKKWTLDDTESQNMIDVCKKTLEKEVKLNDK